MTYRLNNVLAHGALGNAEPCGDLGVGQPLEAIEQQCQPRVGRQLIHRDIELCQGLTGKQGRLGVKDVDRRLPGPGTHRHAGH